MQISAPSIIICDEAVTEPNYARPRASGGRGGEDHDVTQSLPSKSVQGMQGACGGINFNLWGDCLPDPLFCELMQFLSIFGDNLWGAAILPAGGKNIFGR